MASSCLHESCTLRLSTNRCPTGLCRNSTSQMGSAAGNKRYSRILRATFDICLTKAILMKILIKECVGVVPSS